MRTATVTICHSKTSRSGGGDCRRADILVAAIGRAGMVTRDYVKPGATVIDVGINRITDRQKNSSDSIPGSKPEIGSARKHFWRKRSTLVGDVHPEVAEVAGAITPVPGGMGPLTIAMLMANTVKAAMLRRGLRYLELSSGLVVRGRDVHTSGGLAYGEQRLANCSTFNDSTTNDQRRLSQREHPLLKLGLTGGIASGKSVSRERCLSNSERT
jgi:hypothetical protein